MIRPVHTVLENYLARSITMEGLLNGRGDLNDNIRMLNHVGAKFIGRALCLCCGEGKLLDNIQRAKEQLPRVLADDPDRVLQACIFEIVTTQDEITWFAHQSREYRSNWLQYAWNWVRQTDANGFLQMPGSRTMVSPRDHRRWHHANNPSSAVPEGLGDEDAIRAVWSNAAKGP